jgi:hypothetical protein
MKQPSLQTIYSPKRNKNSNRLIGLKTVHWMKWSKTNMQRALIKFTHYYEYLSGSIILQLGDGFLRIAFLWCKETITHFRNKLFLLFGKKD